MASTYAPIATTTLGSNSSSVSFTSISSAYTDIVAVINGGQTVATANTYLRFNNDTSSNYSYTSLKANGSAATSSRESSQTFLRIDNYGWYNTLKSNVIIQIQNYSNTTTFKSCLIRWNDSEYGTQATIGLWRKTPEAINRIDFISEAYQWLSGTTFTLYGIKAA